MSSKKLLQLLPLFSCDPLGVGSPFLEQNPLSLNLLTSLGNGAFNTVSHPVVRRLNVFPVQLVICLILAFPPLPILSVVELTRIWGVGEEKSAIIRSGGFDG